MEQLSVAQSRVSVATEASVTQRSFGYARRLDEFLKFGIGHLGFYVKERNEGAIKIGRGRDQRAGYVDVISASSLIS